jgi:hypothetical protein
MQIEKKIYKEKEINFLKGKASSAIIECYIDGVLTKRGNEVINSVVSSKNADLLYSWKIKIADNINKLKISPISLEPASVSVSFFFYKPFHGNRDFDIENFIKPIIDGAAKGLFSKDWEAEKVKEEKVHFNEDDSIFKKIYLEYHDYIEESKEGIYITVWPLE